MKLAVSSTGKDLNAPIDPRFGRCGSRPVSLTVELFRKAELLSALQLSRLMWVAVHTFTFENTSINVLPR